MKAVDVGIQLCNSLLKQTTLKGTVLCKIKIKLGNICGQIAVFEEIF